MESPDKSTPSNSYGNGANEKIIHIDTCRNCKNHRSSTWHDEAKYESNFNLVKAEIESLIPGVQVLRKEVEVTNLGAFEIMHGEKVIYSKKTSGLWPNAKAVAQRVNNYFKDLEAGRDISAYGTQKEKAFISPKKSSDRKSYTSGFSDFQALSSKSNKKQDSAGGSPEKEGTPDKEKKPEENENGIENHDDQQHKDNKSPDEEHARETLHDQHNNNPEHDHQHGKEEEKTEHKGHEENAENISPHLRGSVTHILEGVREGEHKEEHSPVKHHEGEPHKDVAHAHEAHLEGEKHGEHETHPEAEKHGEHETHEKAKEHEEPGSAPGHEAKTPAEHVEHAENENKGTEGNSPTKAQKNPGEDEYAEDFTS